MNFPLSRKQIAILLLFIALVAGRLSLTGIIAAQPEVALYPDSTGYLFLADRLLNGEGLHGDGNSSIDLQRTPGYPIFLAGVFSLFGDKAYPAVVCIQLAMGVFVALGLFLLGRRYFRASVGIAAAALYLLIPNVILWSLALLTDVLFSLVLIAAFLPLAAFIQSENICMAGLSGLLLGMAALIRPLASMMVLLWTILLIGRGWIAKHPFKKTLAAVGIFLAGAGLVMGIWVGRNVIVWDRAMLSSISTWNLGHYMAPSALARALGISLEDARTMIPTTRIPQPGERGRYIAILLQYPLDAIAAHLHGVRLTLTEAGRPNYAQLLGVSSIASGVVSALKAFDFRTALEKFLEALRDPALRFVFPALAFSLFVQAFSYLGAVAGTVRMLRSRILHLRWLAVFMFLTAAALIFLPGSVGNSRFRVPAEAFLTILAVVGIMGVQAQKDTPMLEEERREE